MRSLRFRLRKANPRLIPAVADCLFRQQCGASCADMLATWLQSLARSTCFDFLV